jgi:putative RNA 2'-phosphotransferase
MKNLNQLSITLAHALRHDPALYGLTLDEGGWTSISSVEASKRLFINRQTLETIVNEKSNERFEIDSEGLKVRAKYGHSVADVFPDLELLSLDTCPPTAMHGTSVQFFNAIFASCAILPMTRNYVHMTTSLSKAMQSGRRWVKTNQCCVLHINLHSLIDSGAEVFATKSNSVLLTKQVTLDHIVSADTYNDLESSPRTTKINCDLLTSSHSQ